MNACAMALANSGIHALSRKELVLSASTLFYTINKLREMPHAMSCVHIRFF